MKKEEEKDEEEKQKQKNKTKTKEEEEEEEVGALCIAAVFLIKHSTILKSLKVSYKIKSCHAQLAFVLLSSCFPAR